MLESYPVSYYKHPPASAGWVTFSGDVLYFTVQDEGSILEWARDGSYRHSMVMKERSLFCSFQGSCLCLEMSPASSSFGVSHDLVAEGTM